MRKISKRMKMALVWALAALLIVGSVVGPGILYDEVTLDPDYTIYMSDEERYPDGEWEELSVGNTTETETANFNHTGSGVLYHQYVKIDNSGNNENVTIVSEVKEPDDFNNEMGFIVLDGIVEPENETKGETVDGWGSYAYDLKVEKDQTKKFTVIYVLSHEATVGGDPKVSWSFYEDTAFYDVDIDSPQEGDEFVEGDDVDVNYNVTNIGTSEGEQDINLTVYNESGTEVYKTTEKDVSIGANESYESTLTWPSEEGHIGEYNLEVSSEDDVEEVNVTMLKDADFQLDIVDHTEEVWEGNNATVYYSVNNTGDVKGAQDINFTVYDGTEVVYEDVNENLTLKPNETYPGIFEWGTEKGDAGEYDLEVASQDDSETAAVTVKKEGYFEVNITDYDKEVVEGNKAVVDYKVENTGDRADTQDILFLVEDENDEFVYAEVYEDLYLEAGEVHYGSFTWQTEEGDPGEYNVSVSSQDDEELVDVTVLDDAFFEVNITAPEEGENYIIGDTVFVNYRVNNTGDVSDTQQIEFIIDGEVNKTEKVELGAGETYEGTFKWTTEAPFGERTLSVQSDNDEDDVNVTVYEELRPPGWIRVEKDKAEGDLTVKWEDTGAMEYKIYYSEDQYANFSTWDELGAVNGTEYTHENALGGENYYIVRSVISSEESKNSTMAFCVEKYFDDSRPRHYISVPMGFEDRTGDGELRASDLVKSIEGDLVSNDNISDVVKWDYKKAGYNETYYYDSWDGRWTGDDFVIEPGDGIGIAVESSFTWHVNATDTEHEIFYSSEGSRHYTSIPYTLKDYRNNGKLRASDLVKAIEGDLVSSDNIYDVVKWDHEAAGYNETYYYDSWDGEWTGDDFVIEPGDSIGLSVKSNFTWQVKLVTPEREGTNTTSTQSVQLSTRNLNQDTNKILERINFRTHKNPAIVLEPQIAIVDKKKIEKFSLQIQFNFLFSPDLGGLKDGYGR